MTYAYPSLAVKIGGELACFTRPETKVERVSYDVITPSAACGLLEAIFWKPQMQWRIREIQVLRPIRHISITRNEIKHRAVVSTAQRWARSGEGNFYADEDRTQRHTLALRDVAYLIKADIVVAPDVQEDPAKYRDQFRRRVKLGQCYQTPYLGCREYAAFFEEPEGDETTEDITADLGRMLFCMDYAPDESGKGTPRFFDAQLTHGILSVPQELYKPFQPWRSMKREENVCSSND